MNLKNTYEKYLQKIPTKNTYKKYLEKIPTKNTYEKFVRWVCSYFYLLFREMCVHTQLAVFALIPTIIGKNANTPYQI